MRKVIWKYPLPASFIPDHDNVCVLQLPVGARILNTAILEDGRPVLWVEFDVGYEWDGKTPATCPNYFKRYPTGLLLPARDQHVKTWVQGEFVWHLYRFEDTEDATNR